MHNKISEFLSTSINLIKLELLVVDVPQKEVFTSAIGKRKSRKALLVKWISQNGVGYGECSCRPDPFYSHEFVSGAIEVIKAYIFPDLKQATTYHQALNVMSKVRGWNFAKAALEMAMNDAIRRGTARGILDVIELEPINKVPVGISLGMFNSVKDLESKLEEIDSLNYQRLKFKISPAYNNEDIIDIFSSLNHPNIAFDANGSFGPESFHVLEKYARLGYIIEQPFPPGEFYLYQEYQKEYKPFQICLDEEIETYGNLVSLGLLTDEVNIKPGRVGGLYNTLKMIEYTRKHGIKTWIGGMFETGIGRAQNLQVAALVKDAKAHDLSPSSRYFERDVVKNPIVMENGFVDTSGFGIVGVDENAIEEMLAEKIVLE